MASSSVAGASSPDFYQNLVIMRHGDRIDLFQPMWVFLDPRPWDPPLIQEGRVRAFATGRTFRNNLPFTFNRVFVSPFLRCLETASEVITALSAVTDDANAVTSDGVAIDPSKLKVSVEYGLCEMMNRIAIGPAVVPRDGNWDFNISECEAKLPTGTVDKNVKRVYKELPKWEEDPFLQTKPRYRQIVKDLADNYHTENLLLVTHGEGVGVSLSTFKKVMEVYEVEYCGYIQLRRPIFKKDQSFTAGEFEVLTETGETGVRFIPNY